MFILSFYCLRGQYFYYYYYYYYYLYTMGAAMILSMKFYHSVNISVLKCSIILRVDFYRLVVVITSTACSVLMKPGLAFRF